MRKLRIISYLLMMVPLIQSCGIYSFTGASIPLGAKTVSVEYFKNTASIFNPTLSQQVTELLQKKLVSQTTLNLTDGKGDLQFKGQIVDYSVAPVALTANETAAMNRLTIKVKVAFINELDETKNFEETFSRYTDYVSSAMLSSVEPSIVPVILEQLTDDIFQKAVVNW
jgi:hypothetical protein